MTLLPVPGLYQCLQDARQNDASAIDAAVQAHYPDESFKIESGKWIVNAPASISRELAIHPGRRSVVSYRILPVNGYSGRTNPALWEWLASKSRTQHNMPPSRPPRERQPQSPQSAVENEDAVQISSSAPSPGDYKLTVDLVGTINHEPGKLTNAVDRLTTESRDPRTKVDRISHIMYAVAAVGTIGPGIVIWIVNKAVDYGLSILKTHH